MDAFKNFIPPETLVIRDGQQKKMPAEEVKLHIFDKYLS